MPLTDSPLPSAPDRSVVREKESEMSQESLLSSEGIQTVYIANESNSSPLLDPKALFKPRGDSFTSGDESILKESGDKKS